MNTRSKLTIATVAVTVAGLAAAVQVRAGGDRVAFPENYAKGVVYLTLDKPDNKQVREYFTSPAAAEAPRKGPPPPSGNLDPGPARHGRALPRGYARGRAAEQSPRRLLCR